MALVTTERKVKIPAEQHALIKALLAKGTSWRTIIEQAKTNNYTISLISKEMATLDDDIKAVWQAEINNKLMQVQDKIADALLVDDFSKLPADKKAIALGIIHDKLHPKAKDSITVQVAVQQTLDIARNAPKVLDI